MLVDDHKMLREGIAKLIQFDSDIRVVSEASCGQECLDILMRKKPDIVLLDINLPDMSGISILREIKRRSKTIKVLMLTVHSEVEYLLDSLEHNADGYILKESGSDELVRAIKKVYNNERYIQSDLIPAYNARLVQNECDMDKAKSLTKRERQMLCCLAGGLSNQEIADKFAISERTVKNHITCLFKKINVKDRTQAAVFAVRNNIIN